MKVISLLEPWASLIKENVKNIETRSWSTNYRGELYIHASKRKLTNANLMEYKQQLKLLKDINFKYGYIIAKCKLVDCIYMTEELINEIKKNNSEYISGDYKVGRYAWVIDDIEALDIPIKAKGQLGIWNYYDENKIMKLKNENINIIEYNDRYEKDVYNFITDIMVNEFNKENKVRKDIVKIKEHYKGNNGNFWICLNNNGKVIGTIGLENHNNFAVLKRYYVDKNYRGLGIGKKLISVFEDFVNINKIQKVYLLTDKSQNIAHKIYENYSFKLTTDIPSCLKKVPNDLLYYKNY